MTKEKFFGVPPKDLTPEEASKDTPFDKTVQFGSPEDPQSTRGSLSDKFVSPPDDERVRYFDVSGGSLKEVDMSRESVDVAKKPVFPPLPRDVQERRGRKLSIDDISVPEEEKVQNFSIEEIKRYQEVTTVKEFLKKQTPIVVKRSSGEEVQGRILNFDEDTDLVTVGFEIIDSSKKFVFFISENKKAVKKTVPLSEFITWQKIS